MGHKIFIAKDYDGETIGIVLAEDAKIASAYFVGRGQMPHSTGVIDPTDDRLGVMGLCTLFKTKELLWSDLRDVSNRRMSDSDKPLRVEDRS